MSRAAVFYDMENCLGPGLGLGALQLKIAQALPEATLTIQRAYADFAKGYTSHIDAFHRYGIQPMQVFGTKPNAVDFEMSLDALRLMLENNLLQIAVIVSNDVDFLPLIRHLRELQLEVVCVLTKPGAHSMLRTAADKVIDLAPAPEALPRAAKAKLVWPDFRKLNLAEPSLDAFSHALHAHLGELKKQAAFAALAGGQGLQSSMLGSAIKKANPDFKPQTYGSPSLSHLLWSTLQSSEWGVYRVKDQTSVYLGFRAEIPVHYLPYEAAESLNLLADSG